MTDNSLKINSVMDFTYFSLCSSLIDVSEIWLGGESSTRAMAFFLGLWTIGFFSFFTTHDLQNVTKLLTSQPVN